SRPPDRRALGITCPSLSMWLDYFPHAKVYGFDLDDFSSVKLPRVNIFRGDQGNVEDLLRVVAHCPRFDIIIDDLLWQPDDLESSLPAACKTKDLLKNDASLKQSLDGVKDILFFDSPIE